MAARARTVTATGSTTIRSATGGSVIRVAGNDCIAECDMPAMTGRCGGSAGCSRGVTTTGAGRTGKDATGGATGGAGLGRRAATVAISVFDTGGNVRRPHKTLTAPMKTRPPTEPPSGRRTDGSARVPTIPEREPAWPRPPHRARCGTAASSTDRPLRRPRAARRCRFPTEGAQAWTLAASHNFCDCSHRSIAGRG